MICYKELKLLPNILNLSRIAFLPLLYILFFLMYRVSRITQEHITLISIMALFGITYLIVAMVKCGHVHFIHTNLFRVAGIGIYLCFVLSFFVEPIMLTRVVIILLMLSFIASILIYMIFGEVDQDVRNVVHLSSRGETPKAAPYGRDKEGP